MDGVFDSCTCGRECFKVISTEGNKLLFLYILAKERRIVHLPPLLILVQVFGYISRSMCIILVFASI